MAEDMVHVQAAVVSLSNVLQALKKSGAIPFDEEAATELAYARNQLGVDSFDDDDGDKGQPA